MINPFVVSDGFTFVKRHQMALIQRLKSVEPVLDHLREQNVLCKLMRDSVIPLVGKKWNYWNLGSQKR